MSHEQQEIRTAYLDGHVVVCLRSLDYATRQAAIALLPTEMSFDEVSAVGEQVNAASSEYAIGEARRKELIALNHIGSFAMTQNADLVTAGNTASVLKDCFDYPSWLILRMRLRHAKKSMIKSLLESVDNL